MQTWNNILNYIKRNTGAKLNLLEMDDDELIEGFQEDVMPLFSQYSPLKKYCIIGPPQLQEHQNDGDTLWKYLLPIDLNEYVIDIHEIYTDSTSNDDPFYGTKYSSTSFAGTARLYGYGSTGVFGGGMIDTVMDNEFFNMLNSMSSKNTWEFSPPKTIRFDKQVRMGCVIYNTNHVDPSTINPDFFHIIFKPLCLGYSLRWISALRSKFENLATPIGELRVNWQKMEQDAEKYIQDAQEKMDQILPDHFLSIE
jgi:hypothetical protein